MGRQGESGAAKAAREKYDQLAAQYQQKREEYDKLVTENTGKKGYEKSLDMAAQEAGRMSVSQSQQAANQAIQAGRAAGGSKASAAMNAMNAAGNTYAQAYNQNMQNQQNQAAGQLNNQVSGTMQGLQAQKAETDMAQQSMINQRAADDKNQEASWQNQLMEGIQTGASLIGALRGGGGGFMGWGKK